jgi:hypothetical protein
MEKTSKLFFLMLLLAMYNLLKSSFFCVKVEMDGGENSREAEKQAPMDTDETEEELLKKADSLLATPPAHKEADNDETEEELLKQADSLLAKSPALKEVYSKYTAVVLCPPPASSRYRH